jgi:hypothetical protein
MRHIALYVDEPAAAEHFHMNLSGMQRVEWRSDPDTVRLISGNDNLVLHRGACAVDPSARTFHPVGCEPAPVPGVAAAREFQGQHGRSPRRVGQQDVNLQMIFHPPVADR